MKFRRPYESCENQFFSCAGETKRPVYTLVNKHGERSLRQVDEIDIPDQINSYQDQTNLKAMLRRYSLTGDVSLLNRGGGYIYEDVSNCETNLARLIERSREIALLKLQNSAPVKEVSESANSAGADAAGDDGSVTSGNGGVSNEQSSEV